MPKEPYDVLLNFIFLTIIYKVLFITLGNIKIFNLRGGFKMFNVKYDSKKNIYFAYDDENPNIVLGESSKCLDTQENELLYYAEFIQKENEITISAFEIIKAVKYIIKSRQLKFDYVNNSKEEAVSINDYYKRVLFNFIVFGDIGW